MKFNWMASGNPYLWAWWDMQIGRFWYVLIWQKGRAPYCYRSTDATPPDDDNEGRWLFGRRIGVRSV